MLNSNKKKPFFLITIDTEGDCLWSKPREMSTLNSRFINRFQDLCDTYNFKPTYLTNYEMAKCQDFVNFGKRVISCKTAEIGMHLHAWNSPPIVPLTPSDHLHQPYLVDYPAKIMAQKIQVMTNLLEDVFGVKVASHRAGRWCFDETYAELLIENGYMVDCSVTPLFSWERSHKGKNYRNFPPDAYWINTSDISLPGDSSLLEVPMTTVSRETIASGTFLQKAARIISKAEASSDRLGKIVAKFSPSVHMLRPNGKNRAQMIKMTDNIIKDKKLYAELMIHSSELMPGGSPYFKNEEAVNKLYDDLNALFKHLRDKYTGATLKEFHDSFKTIQPNSPNKKTGMVDRIHHTQVT